MKIYEFYVDKRLYMTSNDTAIFHHLMHEFIQSDPKRTWCFEIKEVKIK